MYLYLNLLNNIFSQFVINCKKQSDCYEDDYCNFLGQCKECINIKYNLCDAMNGCCTMMINGLVNIQLRISTTFLCDW